MAKYEDYAPKKRGFRLFEAEDVMPRHLHRRRNRQRPCRRKRLRSPAGACAALTRR